MQQNMNMQQAMSMMKMVRNPKAILGQMAESNPEAKEMYDMLQSGMDPKDVFYKSASKLGVDPNDVFGMMK